MTLTSVQVVLLASTLLSVGACNKAEVATNKAEAAATQMQISSNDPVSSAESAAPAPNEPTIWEARTTDKVRKMRQAPVRTHSQDIHTHLSISNLARQLSTFAAFRHSLHPWWLRRISA